MLLQDRNLLQQELSFPFELPPASETAPADSFVDVESTFLADVFLLDSVVDVESTFLAAAFVLDSASNNPTFQSFSLSGIEVKQSFINHYPNSYNRLLLTMEPQQATSFLLLSSVFVNKNRNLPACVI